MVSSISTSTSNSRSTRSTASIEQVEMCVKELRPTTEQKLKERQRNRREKMRAEKQQQGTPTLQPGKDLNKILPIIIP